MKRTYAMIDFEFTSLDLDKALITEWGIVVFDPVTFAPVVELGKRFGVAEAHWDPSTLAWAKANLPADVLAEVVLELSPQFDIHEYRTGRASLFTDLFATINQLIKRFGKKEFVLIANHPECDITLLKKLYKDHGLEYPMHYQNHKDMDSLMMASAGALYDEVHAEWDKDKPVTKHTAISDCIDQINKLKFFGVELP